MKKFFLLIITLFTLCFTKSTQAQFSVGISAGYTNNEFYTNISNYQYNYYKKGGGFSLALPVQHSLANWLSLQVEPGFIQKGFSIWLDQPDYSNISHLTSHYNYLQLPVMAQLITSKKKWKGFADIGAYSSYWLSGNIKGTQPDQFNGTVTFSGTYFYPLQHVNDKYEFRSDRDRRLQFGWLAGIGLQYALKSNMELFAEARYYHDITDQQKKYERSQMPRYNYTAAFSAGSVLNLSLLHKHK